jgi:N4-gp56 family major capsid protein
MAEISNKLSTVDRNGIFQKEYWDNRLLEIIKLNSSNYVFVNLGREVTIPKNEGTLTISMRRYNSLPVRALGVVDVGGVNNGEMLVEGEANAPLKVEAQKIQASVDQFGAWVSITDHVQDIHLDDIKSIYQPELADHAAKIRELNVLAKLEDASDFFVNAGTTTEELAATDILTIQDLRVNALIMKNYNRMGHPKAQGKPLIVVHSNVMADLLDDEDLKDRLLDPGQENAPIKIGTLASYQFYGLTVMETLLAEVQTVNVVTGANLAAFQALPAAQKVANTIYASQETPAKYYRFAANATTPAFVQIEVDGTPVPFNVYTSYLLGKDPYVVTKLGSGAVEWKMTGFEASKDDPLGQTSTFGYRMWTGAKVIDPLAITKIYARSNYDVLIGMDYDYANHTGAGTENMPGTDIKDWGKVADQTTAGEDEENI